MRKEGKEGFLAELKEVQNESPYYKLLGMNVEEVSDGYARLVIKLKEGLLGRRGVMHGGALASLADGAMAVAILSKLGPDAETASIELKINYVAPVASDGAVAEGKVVYIGRKIAVAECDIRLINGDLVAKSLGTYIIIVPGRS